MWENGEVPLNVRGEEDNKTDCREVVGAGSGFSSDGCWY
jgi:hypothetical protein